MELQMDISERLKMVLTMHKLTPSAFADRIGVQRSSVSHVLSGRNKPGLDFLEKILTNFPRVNATWLITGEVKEQESASAVVREESQAPYGKEPAVHRPAYHDNPVEERGGAPAEIARIVIFYANGTFETFRSK